MGIEFPCPHCGRTLHAGDDSAGHRVLCAGCGEFAVVPEPRPGAPPSAPASSPVLPETLPGGSPAPSPFAPRPAAGQPAEAMPTGSGAAMGSPFGPGPPPPGRAGSDNPYQSPTQYGGRPYRPDYPLNPSADTFAIVSLVLGLGGFPMACLCGYLALPVPILGVVFGWLGLRSRQRGLAITGIVLCGLQLLIVLSLILFVVSLLVSSRL